MPSGVKERGNGELGKKGDREREKRREVREKIQRSVGRKGVSEKDSK